MLAIFYLLKTKTLRNILNYLSVGIKTQFLLLHG